MLFIFFYFFTKLEQMSRVRSRGRHWKCRPKKCSGPKSEEKSTVIEIKFIITYLRDKNYVHKNIFILFHILVNFLSHLNSRLHSKLRF